jgi:hypothetical protein
MISLLALLREILQAEGLGLITFCRINGSLAEKNKVPVLDPL